MMTDRRGATLVLRAVWALLFAALGLYVAHNAFGLGSPVLDGFVAHGVYNAILLGSSLVCLARPLLFREDRLAWLAVGVALLAWSAGDLYWSVALADLDEPPYPSLSDVGWLGFYPGCYVGVVLLLRARVKHLYGSLWLDGLIAALAATALVAAVALEPILAMSVEGDPTAVAINLAYPIGDLLLIAFVIGAFAATGWRPEPMWLALGAGLLASAMADIQYLYAVSQGDYQDAGLDAALWPASTLLMAFAAWRAPRSAAATRLEGIRLMAVPAALTLTAIGLLMWDHVDRLSGVAVVLAGATLLVAVVRMWLTFREHLRVLARVRHDSLTDALTGLGNRRRLLGDLEEQLASASEARPVLLLLFDLNGFKAYNDTFGHPAGDALLRRLGQRLAAAVSRRGTAYRMGGDEFCVLAALGPDGEGPVTAAAAAALTEAGDGFSISAACGSVVTSRPESAAADALRVADRSMYANKSSGRASAGHQSTAVLLQVLAERDPYLSEHLDQVAGLCRGVADVLGLSDDEKAPLLQAAALHDVGKTAIPDAILSKPTTLDEEEWGFIRRHTIVGERIMAVALSLAQAARLVRSSHERFEGGGYPDGLAGEAIPLGARIVSVCDAYHAMVSDRPYRAAMRPEDAVAELRRCAGTQFDPMVVEAFAAALAARERAPLQQTA
jgi:two-component system cell cycle response regulator